MEHGTKMLRKARTGAVFKNIVNRASVCGEGDMGRDAQGEMQSEEDLVYGSVKLFPS